MHPYQHAETRPDHPAYIMAGCGETVTYAQLETRSRQAAHLFRELGLQAGDVVAILLENHPRFFELTWAAQRTGLYYTCISSKLSAGEVQYIVQDSGAKALVTSSGLGALADDLAPLIPDVALLMVGDARAPYQSYEAARDRQPTTAPADQTAGSPMLYSSGTTGRPKGVKRLQAVDTDIAAQNGLAALGQRLYGWTKDTVYLSPAPLYHSAPLGWTMAMQALGGTVVVMERFDAEEALKLIERYRVTSAQWVPTHFTRMLKLPPAVHEAYDLSSLTAVFHAAAPCPVPVKEQMIAWWGPIVHEYYAGTEGNGFCAISAQEWLTHKGSVGRGLTAEIRICDEAGEPLPPRTEGLVYFAGGGRFEYHNAPDKTADTINRHGWTTLGDVGWLDEEGYLYLTDRKSFMIISGGVNIYPQEIENLLVTHPKVADVAVIGAPDEEMGEKVVAVIQPMAGIAADDGLRDELAAFCRANLSHVKAPRQIDFMAELPRHDTGKIYKRLVRDRYWGDRNSRIV